MRKSALPCLLLLLTLQLYTNVYGQFDITDRNKPGEEQLKAEADSYFGRGNFLAALPIYVTLLQRYPDNADYRLRTGICYLYKSDEKQNAVSLLEGVKEQKPGTKDIDFYLGKAYHTNYRFNEAIEVLEKVKTDKKISKERSEEAQRLIDNCKNGIQLVENSLDIKIENIGSSINSDESEGVPVLSADETVMIFTYVGEKSAGGLQNEYGQPDPKGQYFEDVFQSSKNDKGEWSVPVSIGENINSTAHDASIGLSADGQKLFLYKDTKENSGDIFESRLEGTKWSIPLRLDGNINTEYWEGSASLSGDENTIYFTSDRPGGYGGRDLYRVKKLPNGNWGLAQNLGATINTIYNEESPFIHPDGTTMYFSSNGHNSMGGHDVFRTTVVEDTGWAEPENIGYPVSTTDDDKFYIVSANGERGYYSSSRLGGYGQNDIYVVDLGNAKDKHALILVKGKVTANDNVTGADINVTYDNGAEIQGIYKANSATGKYILILPAGPEYEAMYEVEGFDPQIEKFDAKAITEYKEIVMDINLYSDDYKPAGMVRLNGNMKFEDTGKPAANTKISITNENGSVVNNILTDALGKFEFTNLPANQKYTLIPATSRNTNIDGSAITDGQPREGLQINDTKTDKNGRYAVKITGATTQMINIEGNVAYTDELNKPASNITVAISNKNGLVKQQVRTLPTGFFSFQKLPGDEEYIISVESSENITVIGQANSSGKPAQGIKINDTQTNAEGTFMLEFKKATSPAKDSITTEEEPIKKQMSLEGIVYSADDPDKPVAGVIVYLTNDDGTIKRQTVTDENGYFRFDDLPADENYTITTSSEKNTIIDGQATANGKPLAGAKLNGTITGEDGKFNFEVKGKDKPEFITLDGTINYAENPDKPAANVKVTVTSKDGTLRRETTTDANGYFRFDELPAEKEYDLSVVPSKNAIISGKVYDQNGNPKEGMAINDKLTGADGGYEIEITGKQEFECSKFIINVVGIENLRFSNPEVYQNVLEKYGNISAEGLMFKVQIGAYRNAKNFNYSSYIDLGKVEAQLLEDEITRFTIGRFNTLNEAENLRQKVIKRGIKDAFITFFCKGERKLLSDSISNKFSDE